MLPVCSLLAIRTIGRDAKTLFGIAGRELHFLSQAVQLIGHVQRLIGHDAGFLVYTSIISKPSAHKELLLA